MNKYVILGLLSGLTWTFDILLISKVILPALICSFLHDFVCFLVSSKHMNIRYMRKSLIIGFIISSIGTLGFMGSIKIGGPMVGAIASSSMPIFTYILSRKYNFIKSMKYLLASLVLLITTLYMEGSIINLSYISILLGLVCSICWSYEIVAVDRYAKDISPESITSCRMLVSSSILGLSSLIYLLTSNESILINTNSLIILIAGAVCYVSYNLWYRAVKGLGAELGNSLNLSYLLFTYVILSNSILNCIVVVILFLLYILILNIKE